MNYETLIKKKFNFLCAHGYEEKSLSENVDDIIQYNGKYIITIWRVLQLAKSYEIEKTIEQNLEGSFFKMMLSINGKDIFECALFNSDDLIRLFRDIEICDNDKEKIIKYASFIKNNIDQLI